MVDHHRLKGVRVSRQLFLDGVHSRMRDSVNRHFNNNCILPSLISRVRLGTMHPVHDSVVSGTRFGKEIQ